MKVKRDNKKPRQVTDKATNTFSTTLFYNKEVICVKGKGRTFDVQSCKYYKSENNANLQFCLVNNAYYQSDGGSR